MSMLPPANLSIPHPERLPDNAHLPTVNKPQTIIAIAVLFLTLDCLAICVRTWIRLRNKIFGWDDLLVILAGITCIYGDTYVCMVHNDGVGLHLWTLDLAHLERFFKNIYVTNIAYVSGAALIKLAILLQYLRLFAVSAHSTSIEQCRRARRLTYILLVVTAIWSVVWTIIAIFPCSPIEKNWRPMVPGRCFGWGEKSVDQFFPVFVGHASSNVFFDLMVLLLPFPFLRTMRLGQKGKAGFVMLYTLGFVIGAIAAGRMIVLTANRAGTIPIPDMTYYTPPIYLFGVLEVNTAIMAACIPIFWPIITGLASNKIFVLNEVNVQVEGASGQSRSAVDRGKQLATMGVWQDDGTDPFTHTGSYPLSDRSGGQTNGIGAVPKAYDRSAGAGDHRHHKSSGSSFGRHVKPEVDHRSSEDSFTRLYWSNSKGNGSREGSISQAATPDYFLDLDREMAGGQTTTTVARTEMPIDHIQALNERQRT